MIYFLKGEGVREALPKNLFSSSSRHLDSTGTPTQSKQSSEETVNVAQPQEIQRMNLKSQHFMKFLSLEMRYQI